MGMWRLKTQTDNERPSKLHELTTW